MLGSAMGWSFWVRLISTDNIKFRAVGSALCATQKYILFAGDLSTKTN